ncbi:MAG: phospholipase A [Planctomycetota bacterium]
MPHASDLPSPRIAALLLAALSGCTLLPPSDAERRVPQGRVEILQNREYSASERAYLISAHRPSYFVAGYNDRFDPDIYAFAAGADASEASRFEAKFQFSGKYPLVQNIVGDHTDLYLGYTQQSYWQVFSNSEALSRPFRETNYEPELFLRHYSVADLPLGGRLAGVDIGINHQSNGQTLALSRSWNRVMLRAAAKWDHLAVLARTWLRFPEPDDTDENPNEYRYLGYGDVRAIWSPGDSTTTLLVRPATESVAFEVTHSFPISGELRLYVQWFSGRGENLFEFEQRSNRLSVGIALTDWLVGD